MAHFAKLETVDGVANVVTNVIVVANADTADASGVEKEYIGAAWLERTLGGVWKQTSYNNSFRRKYAGVGYTYNSDIDAFVPPKPFPSWIFNEETANWDAPVARTYEQQDHIWDESTLSWIPQPAPDPLESYDKPPPPFKTWIWNEETFRWDPPVPYPETDVQMRWDDGEQNWVELVLPNNNQ